MRTFLVLVHLSGVVGVRRELSASSSFDPGFDHLRKEMEKKDKFGIRSSALQKLLTLHGQKATPQVAADLEKVKMSLDQEVVNAIETNHEKAQTGVNDAVTALSQTTSTAVDDKAQADQKHTDSFDCYGQQKSALRLVEDETEILNQNVITAGVECDAVARKEPFSEKFNAITFSCDMSKSAGCKAEIEALRQQRVEVLKSINDAKISGQTAYKDQVQSCSTANNDVRVQREKVGGLDNDFDTKVNECKKQDADFRTILCDKLGVSLREKCVAFNHYNDLKAQIGDTNTDLSEADRENEWDTSQMTSCLLGEYLSNVDIDANSVSDCQAKAVSYDSRFGEFNYQNATVTELMVAGKFTCSEETLSFPGVWDIPADPRQSSKLYVKHELKSFDVGVDLKQNTTFNVC